MKKDVTEFFKIDLCYRPSHDFIAPLMIVERHRRDTRSRTKYKHHNRHCHFQGQVRDDHQSNVALSACNGIVSFFTRQNIFSVFSVSPVKVFVLAANKTIRLI